MNTQGYGQYIEKQINEWTIRKPVTSVAVAASLADAFDIDINNARKITNVNMKRLADKGELLRVQRGVYGRIKDTSFGKVTPRPDDILAGILLHDGINVIGYIVGPTLLNRLGLSTIMPADSHIATNRYRCRLPDNTRIRIYKPIITVTDENAPYLQALETFMAIDKYSVDTEQPNEVLRAMLLRHNIDNEKLIFYAWRHCRHKTLLKTIDIVLGGKFQ
jgi:hypothetical protein